jgi:hypothetical protein
LDEALRKKLAKMTRRSAEERPVQVDFPGEPGPITLPKCSSSVSLMMKNGIVFLQLETEDLFQRLLIPLPEEILRPLQVSVDSAIAELGVGETRN